MASLDSRGVVKIWTVIEVGSVDETGPGVDLGMGLGSSLKLILTASIDTQAVDEDAVRPLVRSLSFMLLAVLV